MTTTGARQDPRPHESPLRPEEEAEAERLAAGLRGGDPAAIRAVIEAFQGRIYAFASRMCRSREDAKDVLQDTLMAMARAAREFRGEGRLSTWVFRIAANACRKMRRRGKFEPVEKLPLDALLPRLGPDGQPDIHAWPETPDAYLERADLRAALEAAVAALPRPYRAVLLLRDVEGLSTEATAQALGLGVPAVKTRLHRARLFLRQRLAEQIDP